MKSACSRRTSNTLQKEQKIVQLLVDAVHVPAELVPKMEEPI
jgi:hypothetical protein